MNFDRSPTSGRFGLAALLVGLLLFSLAFQGARGLWEPDEGRYTNVALNMVTTDEWLTPYLHYEHPHWTKPPMTYWSMAASFEIFGRSEWAARLTSALSFFGTIVLLGLLGRLFLPRQPWLASLLYAGSLLPFVASNLATTDSLLAFWECLGVYAFARANWHPGCHRPSAWLLLMWAAFGLAFLTKGPPGLLPLLAIVAYRFAAPAEPRKTTLAAWPGLLVFLAVALPWYLAVTLRNPGLLTSFFEKEVVARIASHDFKRNAEWYGVIKVYVPALLAGMLPWTWWWLRAAWRGVSTWRAQGRAAIRLLQPQQQFLLWWILLPLAIFCVAHSRLPLYLLPVAAPLVLVTAREMLRMPTFPSKRTYWLLAAWLLLLLALRGAGGLVHSNKDAREVARVLRASGVQVCEEIAFYEFRAMQGLKFYLDCAIEEVGADELEDELLEQESRYWAVRHDTAEEFLNRMRLRGRIVERVADVPRQWLLFREEGLPREEP